MGVWWFIFILNIEFSHLSSFIWLNIVKFELGNFAFVFQSLGTLKDFGGIMAEVNMFCCCYTVAVHYSARIYFMCHWPNVNNSILLYYTAL